MLNRFSLRTLLGVGAILVAVVPVAVLGVGASLVGRQSEIEETMERNELLAKGLASEYEQFLTLHLLAVTSVAAQAAGVEPLNQATLTPILTSNHAIYSEFANSIVVDLRGKSIASNLRTTAEGKPAIGINYSDRTWFKEVLRTKRPVIDKEIHVGKVTGKPQVVLAAPIVGPSGALKGVVAIPVKLEVILALAGRIRIGKTGYALVATGQGAVLTYATREVIQEQKNLSKLFIWPLVAADTSGQIPSHVGLLGGERVGGFATVPGVGWKILVTRALSEVNADATAAYRHVLGWVLLALLAAIVPVVTLARAISRPIEGLRNAVSSLAAGELGRQALEQGPHEVVALAGEFNRMAVALSEKEAQLRQRADQLEAANKELEAFSYSVSHDLRAPLRAINGFSRILLEEHTPQLGPEAQRYLRLVRENVLRMGQLVDDLLAFSRLSRQPLKRQRVSPADLTRQCLEDLRTEREGRRVEIKIGDLPACEADPALLKQVLTNLLSNALKFTRRREVAVIEVGSRIADGESRNAKLQAGQSEIRNPKSEIVYYVRDNGVGFDMRYTGKLFGVFQRLHAPEEYEGTGVGLAIVQRILHRHGGRIWAEAEAGRGATFFFTLEGGGPHD